MRPSSQAVLEKASIDEVYMDVTAVADREAAGGEAAGGLEATARDGTEGLAAFGWGSVVVGADALRPGNEFDRRLAAGAAIACRLRGAVHQQLGEHTQRPARTPCPRAAVPAGPRRLLRVQGWGFF
jgi:nucleotidyltransferase/DNA polymerase involved in DNA repair